MNLNLIQKYNIEDNIMNKAVACIHKNETGVLRLSEKFFNKKTSCLRFKSDTVRLAAALCASEKTYEAYKKMGIDDEIFFDTMHDIAVWCENNANKGLKNYNWIVNHICLELFKIGRLQFQIFKFPYVIYNYNKTPIKFRENVIAVHIQQGEKLDYDQCVKSIEKAKIFFSKYFPDYKYSYFVCDSWLLYDKNREFMKPDSNIIKFQSLFNITMSRPADAQAIEKIFGKREKDVRCYAQKTSLQKAAKEYMMNGGKLGTGFGCFKV